jgi:hypothetical protein
VNFQVTVLKILVSYPDGFAVMEDLKRDLAILATSGRDWSDRTKRLAARVPDLDIFSQGLVERTSGGWQITAKERVVLELMEARPAVPAPLQAPLLEEAAAVTARRVLFFRSGSLLAVRNGAKNAANVVGRLASEQGRALPETRSRASNKPQAKSGGFRAD